MIVSVSVKIYKDWKVTRSCEELDTQRLTEAGVLQSRSVGAVHKRILSGLHTGTSRMNP